MKRPDKNPKELIADVLKYNDNGYLTCQDLAELVFGQEYGWNTRKVLDDKVKRNIYGAIAILAKDGYVVIGKKNLRIKGNPFDRWKVAGEEDKDDVTIILGERRRRADGINNSTKQLEDNAIESNLLPDSERKQLI